MTWQGLVANLAIVALLTSIWSHLLGWLDNKPQLFSKVFTGTVVGLSTVAVMLMSLELRPGVFFDLRSSVITVGAFFGGPVAALISTVISGAYRISQGGVGAPVGTANLVVSALIGLGFRALVRSSSPSPVVVVSMGFSVVALAWATAAMLPAGIAQLALAQYALPTSVMGFFATVTMGLSLSQARKSAHERAILRAAFEQAPNFQYIKDPTLAFIAVNERVAQHNGFKTPADLVGKSDFDLFDTERAEALAAQERGILQTGQPLTDYEEHLAGADGGKRWYRTSKVPLYDHDGAIVGLAGVTVETTSQKQLETELMESRDLLSLALAEMSDGLVMFDHEGTLLFCNEQYRQAFPLTAHKRHPGVNIREILQAVVDTGEQLQVPHGQEAHWVQSVSALLAKSNVEEIELYDGRFLQLRNRPASNGNSLVLVSDVTEIKRAEMALRHANTELSALATTDGLTGLTNRRGFDEIIGREVMRSGRSRSHLSLLMIDVDHFKAYNDIYGHQAGDSCLIGVADSLRTVLRRPADSACRYGGEEFAVVLPETDEDGAYFIAEAIRQHIRGRGITHAGSNKGVVTTSIGLSHYEPHRNDRSAADLISRADGALYTAKTAGRDRVMGWRQHHPV